MVWLAQKRHTGGLGREHARPAFDAELALETAGARNKANDGLREVDVEIVADDVPPSVGGSAVQQAPEKSLEILLSPGIADHAFDLAGGNVEGCDQGLSAVVAVLELAPLAERDFSSGPRQSTGRGNSPGPQQPSSRSSCSRPEALQP